LFFLTSPRREKRGNTEDITFKEFFSRRKSLEDEEIQSTQISCIQKEISPSLKQQNDIVQELAEKVQLGEQIRV
jgi:hypothetical protein